MKEAPVCMNNVVKNVQKELVEITLSDGGRERMCKISKGLPKGEKRKLVVLLEEYKDVFAWDYKEMLGLDTNITHKLNVDLIAKLVKQPTRKYLSDVKEKIKAEVYKILKAGFIEEIKCLEWLANIVLVKKKGG